MQRGTKGASPEQQKIAGETRDSRRVVNLFEDRLPPEPEHIPPPAGMEHAAAMAWMAKVRTYKMRGQKVAGFEAQLRIYCEIEAKLIKGLREDKYNVNLITAYRILSAEFFDTPASQRVKISELGDKANRFTANGRRDAASA